MQVNAFSSFGICLYAGGKAGQYGGMSWEATVTTPPQSAFGTGRLELVQIATPNVTYTTNTNPPQTHNDPENGQTGLDTSYPYGSLVYSEGSSSSFKTNESPLLSLQATTASAVMTNQFNDYLLYQPPGTDVQWVPLATFYWGTNGSAAIPSTGNWADYAVRDNGVDSAGTITPSGTPVDFTATTTFPSWTRIDTFPSF